MDKTDTLLVYEELNKKTSRPPHKNIRSLVIAQPAELLVSADYKYTINWWIILCLLTFGICTTYLGGRNISSSGSDLSIFGTLFTLIVPFLTYMTLSRKRLKEEISFSLSHQELKLSHVVKYKGQSDTPQTIQNTYLPAANIKRVYIDYNPKQANYGIDEKAQHAPRIVFVDNTDKEHIFTSRVFGQSKGIPLRPGYTANQELEWLLDIISSFLAHVPRAESQIQTVVPTEQSPLEPSQQLQRQLRETINEIALLTNPATNITFHDNELQIETIASVDIPWEGFISSAIGILVLAGITLLFKGPGIALAVIIPFFVIFFPLFLLVSYSNRSATKSTIWLTPHHVELITQSATTIKGPWKTTQNVKVPIQNITSCVQVICSHRRIKNKGIFHEYTDHGIRFTTTDNHEHDFVSPAFSTIINPNLQPSERALESLQELNWIYDVVATYIHALPNAAVETNSVLQLLESKNISSDAYIF